MEMQSASEEEKQRRRGRSECCDEEAARLGVSARAGSEVSRELGRNSKRARGFTKPCGEVISWGTWPQLPPAPFASPRMSWLDSVQRVTQYPVQSMLPCDGEFGMRDA